MSEPQSEIDSVVGDRTSENPDEFHEEIDGDETVMLPSPDREGDAKVDATGDMAAEFGPYGEADGLRSEVGKTADPRNWTESTTEFAPGRVADQGIPQPQYEGEYPDGRFDEDEEVNLDTSGEDADDEHPEEETYHRRVGSTLYAEELAWSQRKELEELTEARVHKKGEYKFEVTLNEKQAELDTKCHEEMKKYDSRPAYEKILDDIDPRDRLSQEQMAEVYKFSKKVLEQVGGGVPRHGIARRMAWKIIDPIELPTEKQEITLDATGETLTMNMESVDIPLDYDGTFKDPFADPISIFNAANQVKDELLYELPRTAEGVSQYHNMASIEGRITQMWEPANKKQSHAFNMKDANGETIKVVIWEKANGKKHGLDSFNLTHLDWNDHTGIPDLQEGDLIRIYDGKPSKWQDTLNIACVQDSLITVEEKAERSPSEDTDSSPGSKEDSLKSHNPTARFDRKTITDDYEDGGESLAKKRSRPVWAVKARHGDYDRSQAHDGSGPKEEPPAHPEKKKGNSTTGWRLCQTWIFPKRMCPDWWLDQENVVDVQTDSGSGSSQSQA